MPDGARRSGFSPRGRDALRWALLLLVSFPTLWVLVAAGRGVPAAAGGGLFLDPAGRGAFLGSLEIGLIAAGAAAAAGLPYGWALARARPRPARLLGALALLPLLLPPYAIALAWVLLLNRQGPLAAAAAGWGLPPPTPVLGHTGTAGWILAAAYWPVVAWFVRAGAGGTPADLEDSARLETTARRAAWYAAWPSVAAALRDAVLVVFLLALADFGVANTLGVAALPREIVNRFAQDGDIRELARLSLPLLILVVPLAAWNCGCLRRLDAAPAAAGDSTGDRPLGPGLAAWCALVAAAGALLPLATLAGYAAQGHFWRQLPAAPGPLATSAWLGAATAALALSAALVLRRLPPLADLLVTLPYALPASLLAVAAIRTVNRPGLPGEVYDTPIPLLWVYVTLFLPFAYRLLAPAWPRVDRELRDDARLAGAGTWARFRAVTWPVLSPYSLVAAGVIFVLAGREMDATALLRNPGLTTTAFVIHNELHFSPVPSVAALCLWLVGLQAAGIGAMVAAGTWLSRRWTGAGSAG